jgi:hypothetical protein
VVFSGLVEVSNPKFPDVKISVAPNFQTKIGLGTSPQLPKPVSAETLKSIVPETSKEAGFTEDGIESPMPDSRPSDSPAKGTDQGTEDPEQGKDKNKSGSKSDEAAGAEKKQSDKGIEPQRRSTKPVFAPGGEVTNKGPAIANESSVPASRSGLSTKPGDESSTNSNKNGTPQQQVLLPSAVLSSEIDKVSSRVMTTIERTQESVKESLPPVTSLPKTQTPQRIKVKISLPSD